MVSGGIQHRFGTVAMCHNCVPLVLPSHADCFETSVSEIFASKTQNNEEDY